MGEEERRNEYARKVPLELWPELSLCARLVGRLLSISTSVNLNTLAHTQEQL